MRDALVAQAIQNRLTSLKYSEQVAQKFSKAQHEQFPTTVLSRWRTRSALRNTSRQTGMGRGRNVSIPIFNGFASRHRPLKLRSNRRPQPSRPVRCETRLSVMSVQRGSTRIQQCSG